MDTVKERPWMPLRSPSHHWSSLHRTPTPTPCLAGLPATKGVVMVFVILASVVRVVKAVDVVLMDVVLVDVVLVNVDEMGVVELDLVKVHEIDVVVVGVVVMSLG